MFELRPYTAQARERDLRTAAERGALLAEALMEKKAARQQPKWRLRRLRLSPSR